LGTAQQDISDLQTNIGTKAEQSDLEDAEGRLGDAEDALTALQESGTATQDDLDQAELAVEQAQQDVTDLQTDLGTAQQDISDLQTDVGTRAAQTDLEAAEGRLEDAETELEALQESGTATQDDLDQAELSVQQAQNDIVDIQTRLEGVATKEDIEGVSSELEILADLIGKPPNLLTQEDISLAESYLEAASDEYNALYDVNNDDTFDSEDIRLMQDVVDTGDYSSIAGSQFNPATGMFAREEQFRQDLLDAQAQYESDLATQKQQQEEDQIARDIAMSAQMQNMLTTQTQDAQREELTKALQQQRTVTEQQAPLTNIDYIYDFAGDNVFATDRQRGFYESASMYGDNFLNDIIMPQQQQRRAKGGMITDKTDEILKIIGDK